MIGTESFPIPATVKANASFLHPTSYCHSPVQSTESLSHRKVIVMELTTILTIAVLNILLPTADVITDINLAVKLYKPLAEPECVSYFSWRDGERLRGIYEECREDPWTFCSKDENREYCILYDHSKTATVLLIPCLLNYIVCFYTFFRLTTNRKRYTFIFPLLNLYPQYGKILSS